MTLAALRGALGQPLGAVLQADFRLVDRMVHGPSDFGEGVRASLVDRDGKPNWSPPSLEEVSSHCHAVLVATLWNAAPVQALLQPSLSLICSVACQHGPTRQAAQMLFSHPHSSDLKDSLCPRSQVTEDMVARFFAPLPSAEELQLPRGDDRAKL